MQSCILFNENHSVYICSPAPNDNITYSDTYGGQNVNQFQAASYLYTISKIPKLKTLNHAFLQSGHRQIECNSIRIVTETAKKKTSVYVPFQWSTLISMSWKTTPYVTIPLKYDHAIDFNAFVNNHSLNFQTTTMEVKCEFA